MSTTRYLAWHGLFPYKRFGSPFFWVGTLGVGLGVMLLIIVLSVMQGFGATYRQKIVELGGDLRVESPVGLLDPEEVLAKSQANSHVAAAAPYGQGFMMVEHERRPAFPVVRGIDPELEAKIIPFAKQNFIKDGSLNDMDDDSVLLSALLARQIGATLGSTVEVYTPMMITRLTKDELLLPKPMRVAGLYETGWHDFDQNTMLMTLSAFQDLYGLGIAAHGVTIRLKDSEKLDEATLSLQTDLPGFRLTTWKETYKDFLWVLDLERNMMFFLMLFVIVVAAFAMGAAQLMTVLRKTREIGLLMAMGATQRAVAAVYALQGAIVGVAGVVLGNALALTILAFRNDILHAIAQWTGTYETLVSFYQFYNLPMAYGWEDALHVGIVAIILATLSGLLPAVFVAKLQPAEALRNE